MVGKVTKEEFLQGYTEWSYSNNISLVELVSLNKIKFIKFLRMVNPNMGLAEAKYTVDVLIEAERAKAEGQEPVNIDKVMEVFRAKQHYQSLYRDLNWEEGEVLGKVFNR